MKKILSLSYGLVCYLAFFGTFLYAIGFVGNLFVPKSIDGAPDAPLLTAVFCKCIIVTAVCPATQHHGTTSLQALVDEDHPGTS